MFAIQILKKTSSVSVQNFYFCFWALQFFFYHIFSNVNSKNCFILFSPFTILSHAVVFQLEWDVFVLSQMALELD